MLDAPVEEFAAEIPAITLLLVLIPEELKI